MCARVIDFIAYTYKKVIDKCGDSTSTTMYTGTQMTNVVIQHKHI